MPRTRRAKSASGIYHITARGVNRRTLFFDDKDHAKYCNFLHQAFERHGLKLLAYCLMPNHVHLLVLDPNGNISDAMHNVQQRYSQAFNKKYERVGHLFQSRFNSFPIETESYLLSALNYIHENPVKAHLATAESYRWSSLREYLGEPGITDTGFLSELLEDNLELALYERYELPCNFIDGKTDPIADDDAAEILNSLLGKQGARSIEDLSKPRRDRLIHCARERGLSTKQLAAATGLHVRSVRRILQPSPSNV